MKNFRAPSILLSVAAILPFASASTPADSAVAPTGHIAYLPPVLREASTADTAVITLPAPPVITEGPRPVLHRTQPELPAAFQQDSMAYLESRLNQWQAPDAKTVLGEAERQRPSYDDDGKPNGSIYAYADPLHRYKGFELDFEGGSGKLRTVFLYPAKMTWRECRASYGSNVSHANAGNGRTFYSYLNRRLDVLVDASGNIISLGIY